MSALSSEDRLSDQRYVTVTLRLLIDQRGRPARGEIVDWAVGSRGRFVGWRGLARALRALLVLHASADLAGRDPDRAARRAGGAHGAG